MIRILPAMSKSDTMSQGEIDQFLRESKIPLELATNWQARWSGYSSNLVSLREWKVLPDHGTEQAYSTIFLFDVFGRRYFWAYSVSPQDPQTHLCTGFVWRAMTEPHLGHFRFFSLAVDPLTSYIVPLNRRFFVFFAAAAAAGAGFWACDMCGIIARNQYRII